MYYPRYFIAKVLEEFKVNYSACLGSDCICWIKSFQNCAFSAILNVSSFLVSVINVIVPLGLSFSKYFQIACCLFIFYLFIYLFINLLIN